MNFEFEGKSLILIEQRTAVITEIERTIFTRQYNLIPKHYKIFSTNSIPMLYAIWEGFIQNIFGLYIDGINSLQLPLFDLHESIVIYCMERKFRQLKNYPQDTRRKINYINNMRAFYANEYRELPRVIDTQSNVGLEVLNKLLLQFNIDKYPDYWQDYSHPVSLKDTFKLFLRLRNKVAHGGELLPDDSINRDEYQRFKKLVIDLMYDIRDKMLNNLNNSKFKRL